MLAGLVALSLAACGSTTTPGTSTTAASGPSSTSSSPAPAAKARAAGLVASVSGGTVTVTGTKGPTTVDVTPSTRVTQTTPGQLTGVTVGECIVARPAKNGGTPPTVTAASVAYGTAENGQCSRTAGGDHRAVVGTVASVNGTAIAVTSTDGAADTVTVTPATRYAARSDATPSVIAAGQCLTARGTADGSGTLQAQDVAVRPSRNGQCGEEKHHEG
ncbi:DUF5666 domain-containing protein [Mycobacterium sp. NPDC006124]|uniref:DUF5666 domain-containing protein n=1 Tax=Mycobacterium sp. NPDC006124 TaxID=3156729 RepID=UPI0033A4629E